MSSLDFSIHMRIHLHALINFLCREVQLSQSVEVETEEGPWEWFKNKGNSTTLQKYIVPLLIALHGFCFAKKIKDTTQIREMIVALCTEHKFLQSTTTMTPEQAANSYPMALLDVAKRQRRLKISTSILNFNALPVFIVYPST